MEEGVRRRGCYSRRELEVEGVRERVLKKKCRKKRGRRRVCKRKMLLKKKGDIGKGCLKKMV